MGEARSNRRPHNPGVPKIMDLFRDKLALNCLENYATPGPRDPPVPVQGPKEGEGAQGPILNFEFRASFRW